MNGLRASAKHGRSDGRTDGQAVGRTDGQAGGRAGGRAGGQTGERNDQMSGKRTEMDVRTDRQHTVKCIVLQFSKIFEIEMCMTLTFDR